MVIAFALCGQIPEDISRHPLGLESNGKPIFLEDLWPTEEEISATWRATANPVDFAEAFAEAERSEAWRALAAPETARFPWDERSTYVRRPPFASLQMQSRLGTYRASPLIVLGDDMTTDHISPAGQIDPSSYAGHHLIEMGDPGDDLNVYAARRGNWRAMVRGLFDNRSAANLLLGQTPASTTKHGPSGATGPLWKIARRYQNEDRPVVVVGGERYGAGSSRDWAAKGVALLGARAVLANSFERIHRSNLINMGVLPILLPEEAHPQSLNLTANDTLTIDASSLSLRGSMSVIVERSTGTQSLACTAAIETEQELMILKAGGMIPLILERTLLGHGSN